MLLELPKNTQNFSYGWQPISTKPFVVQGPFRTSWVGGGGQKMSVWFFLIFSDPFKKNIFLIFIIFFSLHFIFFNIFQLLKKNFTIQSFFTTIFTRAQDLHLSLVFQYEKLDVGPLTYLQAFSMYTNQMIFINHGKKERVINYWYIVQTKLSTWKSL